MKKYLWMSSAAVVICALRVKAYCVNIIIAVTIHLTITPEKNIWSDTEEKQPNIQSRAYTLFYIYIKILSFWK